MAAIKKLASSGLPFRGDYEKLGSIHNANFFMLLEYLSEFDPFLKEHFRKYGKEAAQRVIYLKQTSDYVRKSNNRDY